MKLTEMKKFEKVAEIGVAGYAIEESGLVRVWDGNEWIGHYRVDGNDLVKVDPMSEMLNAFNEFGISE